MDEQQEAAGFQPVRSVTQRQVVIGLFVMQLVATLLILAGQLQIQGDSTVTLLVAASAIVVAGLLLARYLNIGIITLVIGLGLPEPYVTQITTPVALVPPALALILAEPAWIIGSMAAVIVVLTYRGGGHSAYIGDLRTVGAILILTAAMFLSRLIADAARRRAEQSAAQVAETLANVERQARRLEQSAADLADQNTQQRHLLDLVATLETPAITLAEGVLLAPLVGHLDSRRARALTSRLLHSVGERQTRLVVLDIAGVAAVDAEVAQALMDTVRALRLLGCDVTVTGISAAVAKTLTETGGALSGIVTARTPQDALARYAGTVATDGTD
jgi:rsbT co-antagonist protein RsbR